MAITIADRKEKYYKLVLIKGEGIYFSWEEKRVKSKRIVAKANEYVLDKRLQSDFSYRFHALSFAYALGLRLTNRYRGFIRKIFRIFAYLRERNAFWKLKNALGGDIDTDVRDLVSVDAEKISVQLSIRSEGRLQSGGKNVAVGDEIFEKELQKFFSKR